MARQAEMSERDLQGAILEAAKLGGWLAYHTFDSRHSQAGFPDLVLVHSRRCEAIFAELKRENGRLSLGQLDWGDALEAVEHATQGVVRYEVWRPSDLDRVIELLTRRSGG